MRFLKEQPPLGVIGGLGPRATTHFMELAIRMTDAATDQQNLDMIVYNFPSIPDRTGYILGSNLRSPLPGLLSVGRELARQGVTCIAIPSVTAHYFYEELQAAIPAPIINIIRETVHHLRENGVRSAGIMATEGTIVSGLFTGALEKAGITPILPSAQAQEDVTHLIYRNIKAGRPAEMERFGRVRGQLRAQGAEVIILGCTELSLIKRDCAIGPGFLDAMEVLAQQAVARCGKPLKPEYRRLIT